MTTQIFKPFPPRNSQSLKTQVIKHLLAGPIRGGGVLIYYLILTTSPQAGIIALIVHMKKQVL